MVQNLKIRKFRKGDEFSVSKVVRAATSITNKKFYSPSILKQYFLQSTPKKILERSKEKNFRVAVLNKKIVGVIGLCESRVRQFFVHPTHQGKGIGRALIEYIELTARKMKIRELSVHSSLSAVGFYKHFGFRKIRIIFPNKKLGRISKTVLMNKVLSKP